MPSRSRALIAALLAGFGAPAWSADLVGAFTWNRSDPNHGGFSGIEILEDGADFVAVSDRSGLVRGRLERIDGVITGATAGPVLRVTDLDGGEMTKRRGDSEGLAIAPTGELFVSFEGTPRIWTYGEFGATPRALPRPREFDGLGENSALEALAIGPDGALYTIPEQWGHSNQPHPVWRLKDGRWDRPFTIPKRGAYRPVGADFDDTGRLYVLERYFSVLGFASRVRRFAVDPDGRLGEEWMFESEIGEHDNLEGLAVWRDAIGALRLTMISDDNFRFFQRTEFVEYRVPD